MDISSKLPSDVSAGTAAIMAPGRRHQRRAAVLSVLAGLIWPLQAAVVAWAIGAVLSGASPSPLAAILGFGGLGLLRVALTTFAEAQAHNAADAILARARTEIVANEARRATDSAFGGAGSLAALAGEKLDLLAPYVSRYAPARAGDGAAAGHSGVGVLAVLGGRGCLADFWPFDSGFYGVGRHGRERGQCAPDGRNRHAERFSGRASLGIAGHSSFGRQDRGLAGI